MDKEINLDELIAQAKQALENPALKLAFKDLEDNAWSKFKASQGRDSEAREKIYWFLKALEEFRGQLNVYLSDEIAKKSKKRTPDEEFQERFNLA